MFFLTNFYKFKLPSDHGHVTWIKNERITVENVQEVSSRSIANPLVTIKEPISIHNFQGDHLSEIRKIVRISYPTPNLKKVIFCQRYE
jgi:hypothetical protein